MKKRRLFSKIMLLACYLLLCSLGFSQVNEEWVRKHNISKNQIVSAVQMALDGSGNVYVTGESGVTIDGYSKADYTTIKYDATGKELWTRLYNGPVNGRDVPTAIAADASGNVYVTGWSGKYYSPPDDIESFDSVDYATVKYDTYGNEKWVKRYDGDVQSNGYDEPSSLVVDASGNVYVTGYSEGDYLTIKYDSSGKELWIKRHDGFGGNSLAVDKAGDVYVAGGNFFGGNNVDYEIVKYDAAGNELGVIRHNKPGTADQAALLALDALGNLYVTGSSHGNEVGSGDYLTIKYDTGGNELWARTYNGPANGDDNATSMAVDGDGNVYVTGISQAPPGDYNPTDYATIKYDAAGRELWVKRYNSPDNLSNAASSMSLDASGNVYVTGVSDNNYATIKYDADGNELWAKRFQFGDATDLAVDKSGNVYVTGRGFDSDLNYSCTTIKYSQSPVPSVTSLTLINADNDKAIAEIKDGDTLNLAALPSLNLNIRAKANPDIIGSVMFTLSGSETHTHTENISPYALFADNTKGDYYPWTPNNGNYTLTATPFSGAKGAGVKGTPLTIHFTVAGTAVTSLLLVNAETDQDIQTIKTGDVIDLSALPTTKVNIRAVVHPDTVGSVVFNLNDKIIVRENYAPYLIGGDIKGDFRAWTLPTGKHVLTATPYERAYGKGKKGKAYSVAFTVVDGSAKMQMIAANDQHKQITNANGEVTKSLRAVPNPFFDQTSVSFSVPESGYTTVQVYDVKGAVVERLYQARAEVGKIYNVTFKSKVLRSGVYILRVATAMYLQSCKLVLVR